MIQTSVCVKRINYPARKWTLPQSAVRCPLLPFESVFRCLKASGLRTEVWPCSRAEPAAWPAASSRLGQRRAGLMRPGLLPSLRSCFTQKNKKGKVIHDFLTSWSGDVGGSWGEKSKSCCFGTQTQIGVSQNTGPFPESSTLRTV